MKNNLPRKYIYDRDDYILSRCKGKKVLHTGAADWPFTEQKYNAGNLLYRRLGQVVSDQLGIDLDKESVNWVNKKSVPNSHIIVKDLNDAHDLEYEPDVIIFGETLEHLMNLETALTSIKRIMKEDTELIISVPNALYLSSFLHSLRGKEYQHPDHSAAFTYMTLMTLLGKVEFEVDEFYFTFLSGAFDLKQYNFLGKIKRSLKKRLVSIFPTMSGTLLVNVSKKKRES